MGLRSLKHVIVADHKIRVCLIEPSVLSYTPSIPKNTAFYI
jgi:hypothetical protein